MKLIYDCDNTIGLPGKDVDDGITLLYLYRQKTVSLLGVTLTFGNGTLAQVMQQTDKLKRFFGLNVFTYPGKEKGDKSQSPSPAAQFLVQTVTKYPKEVTILATGSMHNLWEAARIEPNFFNLVQEIVVMGGRFGQMTINGTIVGELNFSIAGQASQAVVNGHAPLTVVSGQYIGNALFRSKDLDRLKTSETKRSVWLRQAIMNWIKYTKSNWAVDGFVNWDGITAFALLNPEQFDFEQRRLVIRTENRDTGLMEAAVKPEGRPVKVLTEIKDFPKLNTMLIGALNQYE